MKGGKERFEFSRLQSKVIYILIFINRIDGVGLVVGDQSIIIDTKTPIFAQAPASFRVIDNIYGTFGDLSIRKKSMEKIFPGRRPVC